MGHRYIDGEDRGRYENVAGCTGPGIVPEIVDFFLFPQDHHSTVFWEIRGWADWHGFYWRSLCLLLYLLGFAFVAVVTAQNIGFVLRVAHPFNLRSSRNSPDSRPIL